MAQIHELSALDLAAAVRTGDVTPAEVLEHTLDRARRLGPAVGAFVHLAEERAAAQAAEAAEQLAAVGRAGAAGLAPLLGVPVPVKDLAQVAGLPFECGSAAFVGNVAAVDDGVVTLLRAAGTLMVGKTTTPELGLPAYTEPDVAAPARTPWDLARSAGGSSGGAAAAVAAGIVPAAHGSDGGGSLRIPAAVCGLVALKPSRGRVSTGPHGVDGAGLTTNGVLTRTVRDTAALLDVLAQPWPGDQNPPTPPRTTFLDACDRLAGPVRVGLLLDPITTEAAVAPQAVAAAQRAARLLEGAGHHVDVAPVPFDHERWDAFMPLWAAGALTAPVPVGREEDLVPLTRWMRELGRSVTGAEYATAVADVQRLARVAALAWSGFDVILTPTLAQAPAMVGGQRDDADPAADFQAQKEFTPWTSTFNLLGSPSISVPIHRAPIADGGPELPFGAMLSARLGREELLLSLAALLEAADPWPLFAPGWPEGVLA